jgi:DNA-binding LacI/PurR family transcriptional regulator
MSTPSPKYIQIKQKILAQIRDGELSPGSRIYSISEIMEKFHVSKVTAVRALAEMESEGFVRREHGRGTFVSDQDAGVLQMRTSKRVALIVPDMANPFNVEVVGSVEKHLREAGVIVELSCTGYLADTERELFNRIMAGQHAAGMVLISGGVNDMGFNVSAPGIPLVVIDHCPDDLMDRCVFINCDHYRGGYEAGAHLAEKGHREIGYVDWVFTSRARLQGFNQALAEHRLALPENRIFSVGAHKQLGHDFIEFVRREKLTALFAVNDMLAMQAMQVLRANKFAIPGDISLMGYDDVLAARYLEIPLTSVEQHEEQIGRKAAECILQRMDARQSAFRPREILIVPRVVERASTGRPKGGGR